MTTEQRNGSRDRVQREPHTGRVTPLRQALWCSVLAALALIASYAMPALAEPLRTSPEGLNNSWDHYLPPSAIAVLTLLLGLSAFFSSSEAAFLSIPRQRIRALREENAVTARWVVRMLENPGRLITTILVGNMFVNTLIGVVLGTRVEEYFQHGLAMPPVASYPTAIILTTALLLFFGEITPIAFAVRAQESYARIAVVPLMAADRVLLPIRNGLLAVTEFLFRITRFHDLHAAPFITDEELKSAFSEDQTRGVIEEDERLMIRGILEVHDVQLRAILIPRPDVVALPEDATVREAHELFCEHEYSRVPIYREDLDHIIGVLFSKDLLPSLAKDLLDQPINALARPPHFVPEIMTVKDFIKNVQRLRSHLAVVVDEFGGTQGIVTLHDAVERVVGDIQDEGDDYGPQYEILSADVYRVEGSLPLDTLSDLLQVPIEDEEHNTVSGFLMHHMERIPAVGDRLDYQGITFTVEKADRRRASLIKVETARKPEDGSAEPEPGEAT